MDAVVADEEDGQESPENLDNTILDDQSTPPEEHQVPDEGDHSWRHPKRDINELRNPLPFVQHMRQSLFEVKEPVDLKEQEFNLYWPYIDNVWVRQHKYHVDQSGRSNTDYYACRLQRATYAPKRATESRPEGQPQRKKKIRPGGTCQMRIKVTKHQGQFKKLTISRIGEHEHTHDLEHLDKIKRNSAVMDIARSEVMKGYMPASVYTVMHEEPGKLAIIGGKYINRNDVRNASQHWRQANKGELGVHPGYKYDRGTGIMSVSASAGNGSETNLPTHTTHPSLPPLPQDTLYFPPQMSTFLAPYLPPRDAISKGSLPHVTLTYATSMDSFLALSSFTPTPISGPLTKAMTHYLRSCHDAIMIGVGTAIADDPKLNCRLAGSGGYGGLGWSQHPIPVIIDPSMRWQLSEESRVLKAVKEGRGRAPWVVVAPQVKPDQNRIDILTAHGGKYLGLPDFDNRYRLNWESIFRALADSGIRSVMVEGGGVVLNELLRPENARLVRNAIVTIAPTYLGMGGVGVCPNRKVASDGTPVPAVRFRGVSWNPLGEDVVMCGHLSDAPETPGNATLSTNAMVGQLPIEAQTTQNAVPVRINSTGQDHSEASSVRERENPAFNQLEQAAGFGPSNE